MSFLSFLGAVSVAPKEKAVVNRKKDRNPVVGDIRVFKNGSVYPSQKLVEDFNLEYGNKDAEEKGYGFDVIDSRSWTQMQSPVPFLMVAHVAKNAGKVDLFSACTYNEDGTPAKSVMDQGATTFGKQLLEMAKEVYGVEPTEEKGYIDMSIVADENLALALAGAKGIYFLPKTVARGENKGKADYVRRENVGIYAFVPTDTILGSANSSTSTSHSDTSITENAETLSSEDRQDLEDAGLLTEASVDNDVK